MQATNYTHCDECGDSFPIEQMQQLQCGEDDCCMDVLYLCPDCKQKLEAWAADNQQACSTKLTKAEAKDLTALLLLSPLFLATAYVLAWAIYVIA